LVLTLEWIYHWSLRQLQALQEYLGDKLVCDGCGQSSLFILLLDVILLEGGREGLVHVVADLLVLEEVLGVVEIHRVLVEAVERVDYPSTHALGSSQDVCYPDVLARLSIRKEEVLLRLEVVVAAWKDVRSMGRSVLLILNALHEVRLLLQVTLVLGRVQLFESFPLV